MFLSGRISVGDLGRSNGGTRVYTALSEKLGTWNELRKRVEGFEEDGGEAREAVRESKSKIPKIEERGLLGGLASAILPGVISSTDVPSTSPSSAEALPAITVRTIPIP